MLIVGFTILRGLCFHFSSLYPPCHVPVTKPREICTECFERLVSNILHSLRNADRVSLPRDETQSAREFYFTNQKSPTENGKIARGTFTWQYTASRDGRANYITSDYHNIIKAIWRLCLKTFARFLVFKD